MLLNGSRSLCRLLRKGSGTLSGIRGVKVVSPVCKVLKVAALGLESGLGCRIHDCVGGASSSLAETKRGHLHYPSVEVFMDV